MIDHMKTCPYRTITTYTIPVTPEGPDEIIHTSAGSVSPRQVKLEVDTDEDGDAIWIARVYGDVSGGTGGAVYSSLNRVDCPEWLLTLITEVTG